MQEQIEKIFISSEEEKFLSYDIVMLSKKIYIDYIKEELVGINFTSEQQQYFLLELEKRYKAALYDVNSYIGIQAGQDLISPITQAKLKSFYNVGFNDNNDVLTRYKNLIINNINIENSYVYLYFMYSSYDRNILISKTLIERNFKDFISKVYIEGTIMKINLCEETLILANITIDDVIKKINIFQDTFIAINDTTLLLNQITTDKDIISYCNEQLSLMYPELYTNESINTINDISKYTKINNKLHRYYHTCMQQIVKKYENIYISGVKNIKTLLVKDDYIIIKGILLQDVVTLRGVDHNRTYSTNIYDMYQTYGIEVASKILQQELIEVIFVNKPNLYQKNLIKLLVAMLTRKGILIPINVRGLEMIDADFLTRLSFERASHVITNIAFGLEELINSVSSKLILGQHL
jgi:hypothetical protein